MSVRSVTRFIAAGLLGCTTPAEPRVADSELHCPPCPDGTYCAADVMLKDATTGKIVCRPTYCLPGPNPICELDPAECTKP